MLMNAKKTALAYMYMTRNSSGDEIANVNFLYNEARPPYWTATK